MSSWRPSPFVVGRRYVVKQDFESWQPFIAGELLEYVGDQHIPYDEATEYFFKSISGGGGKKWSLRDTAPVETWKVYFSEAS
jgi:hypothetical protein